MYSIVIPIFNERETLLVLCQRLKAVMDTLDATSEVILVDDGSSDGSFELLHEIHKSDPRFKVLQFSRNFGHQIAISAGMEHARGDAVILMDGDLQDPPEVIPEMVEKWKMGHEVVYAVKKSRQETWPKRFAFTLFYRVLNFLSAIRIPLDAGNFSLLDRRVVEVFREMPERNRYISGMRAWAGFRQIGIRYDRDPRLAGKPQMTVGRLIHRALDGIFSFSNIPMRLAAYVGVVAALVSFGGGIYVLYAKLFTDKAILGWASTILSVLFVGGIILITLGVIGEYISRIYEEVKKRPLYVVKERIGF
jgi:dolichol-phosphate mannosyltransferase